MITADENKKILSEKFKEFPIISKDQYTEIHVNSDEILSVIKDLKDDKILKYDQLIDLTAID